MLLRKISRPKKTGHVNTSSQKKNEGRYKEEITVLQRKYSKLESQLKQSLGSIQDTRVLLKKEKIRRNTAETALRNAQGSLGKKVKERTTQLRSEVEEKSKLMGRWRAIFENVEEGVFFLDRNMNISQMNEAAERNSGISESKAVGKKYFEVFGCRDNAGNAYPDFCPVEKVCITREPIPYDEHRHTDSSGKESWVGVSYTPIFSKEAEIEQIVGIVRDITALKEIEKAKSEFVSIASHELRTPLTIMNGYLSLLLSGDISRTSTNPIGVREMQVISKVFHETKRLTKLVEDLLNISRIEEKRLKLNLKDEPFSEIVDEVVSEFRPKAESQGINLKVEIAKDRDSLIVRGDRDKIKQVLVNLVDNAIKFTDKGGKVEVKCSQIENRLVTHVIDTGIGIKKNLLPKIFEKFQQEPGSYLKENKGTGLGLFIVKSLVELHAGGIQVKSLPGKGTTFTFDLPCVD